MNVNSDSPTPGGLSDARAVIRQHVAHIVGRLQIDGNGDSARTVVNAYASFDATLREVQQRHQ